MTLPPSVRISFGPHPFQTITPSSRASATSSAAAGISSGLSRQYMLTDSEPERSAVLATSMATFPPPMTTVLPESSARRSARLIRYRNSTPVSTPSASSPGTPAFLPPWAPIAT